MQIIIYKLDLALGIHEIEASHAVELFIHMFKFCEFLHYRSCEYCHTIAWDF